MILLHGQKILIFWTKPFNFKLYTGADVTVVSQSVFNSIFSSTQLSVLQPPEKPLFGPGRVLLDVTGFTRLQLIAGAKQSVEKAYVIRNQDKHLLGLPAILALGLLVRVGFWQVPLTEVSAKYTTFRTPFGWFHFNRLLFGIASAPEHF